jgi:hypothetical protein
MHTGEKRPQTCSVLWPSLVSFQCTCAFKENRFPVLIPEVQLRDLTVGVWCAISVASSTALIFFRP